MKFFSTLIASTLGTLVAFAVVFVFGFLFLVALVASSDTTPSARANSVLVLRVQGSFPEVASDDPFEQILFDEPSVDARDVKRAIRHAKNDRKINALWIRLRSSTMPWSTAMEIREAIEDFKSEGKTVYASSEDYSINEAMYYLASAADSIFAAPQAGFEFNGFYIAAEFYKRLLDKLDVQAQVIRAGQFKSATEQYSREDLSELARYQLEELVRDMEADFLDTVGDSRGMKPADVRDMYTAKAVMSAADAYQAGLLDGLLYEDEVRDLFKERLGLGESDKLRSIAIDAYARTVPGARGRDGTIAVVYANGVIMSGEDDDVSADQVGSTSFTRAIERAASDESIDAIVVRINSPGGSAPAADAMRRAMDEATDTKPVVVSMGGVAASGGYWMAMAADSIIANPLTITGSIGVYSMILDIGGLLENKIGISYDIVSTSEYADMYSGLRPISASEREIMESYVDATYDDFLQLVAKNRDMTKDDVHQLAQGRVWSGQDALDVRLVDSLGDLENAISAAAELAQLEGDDVSVREMTTSSSFFGRLTSSTSSVLKFIRATRSPFSVLQQRALELKALIDGQYQVQARMQYDLTFR